MSRIERSDGRLEIYQHYTRDGLRVEEVLHTTSSVAGPIPGKSTAERRYEDRKGNVVREESLVYSEATPKVVSSTLYTYDDDNRVVRTRNSNGTETSASWGCCGYDTQTDEQGITTTYAYDELGRVTSESRDGIETTHTYDAAGREIETRRSSSSGAMKTTREYDQAGRLLSSTDQNGKTTYAYSNNGRTTTVTRPDGSTEITTVHVDGRPRSVTGSGVVAQFTSYSVAPGQQITEQRVGAADSLQFERTVVDMLGRTVRTERSGYNGAPEVSESFYDVAGRLVRQTNPGAASTLFAYDTMGNQLRTAQDLNNTQSIELGADRVQESDSSYVTYQGAAWQQTVQRIYPTESGAATVVGTQRMRLEGLSKALSAESENVDIAGNVTNSRVYSNGSTVTQIVNVPDSDTDQVTVSIAGRVVSATSSSGVTTAFTYDGFGRRLTGVDSRTGTSTTRYNARGQVDYVEDAAGNRTSFAYDVAGRKISETNALGKVTRFAYTTRGELYRTWGDVPYPVEYQYDDTGRRTVMRTFRAGEFSTAWAPDGAGDATTWEYDAASGLLKAKRDAAGQAVTYSYGLGGRLATRTWARRIAGAPLVTTYNYHPASGDLQTVDYSDTTPDVSFEYDLLGRPKTVTDGTGTHAFAYNASTLALQTETRTGLVPATITHKTATSGVVGRSTGFSMGTSYDVTYGYDAEGRLNSVGWNVNGQTDTVTYGRAAGSELLSGLSYASGVATSYGYEAKRDLKTQVKNVANGATVSQYDYAYDVVGRRTSVANTGTAFQNAAFNKWQYNDRNELIESGRYLGADVTQTSAPVAAEHRAYAFDPIGNRTTATEGTATAKSYRANLLNEYTSAAGATPTYDADGNLTSDGTRKFTYDADNRLTLVEPLTAVNGAVRVRMAYDYLGRRVRNVVEEYNGVAWAAQDDVRFVYLGWNVLEERQASGGVSTNKNFAWGLDLSRSMDGAGGIGGLLAVVDDAGGQMAFLYDANGNVGQLVDESGAAVARYEYSPFGEVLVAAGPAANDNSHRFSTKQFGPETGLYYFGYRFYSPEAGRWVNRDPAQEDVGGLNLYAFVLNGPSHSTDYLGLAIEDVREELKQLARKNGVTLADVRKLLADFYTDGPVFTLFGTAVHQIIFEKYRLTHPGAYTDTRIASILDDIAMSTHDIGRAGDLRPDIVNVQTNVVYEVKSVRGAARARREALEYREALRKAGLCAMQLGEPGPETEGEAVTPNGIRVSWNGAGEGVILYDFTGLPRIVPVARVSTREQLLRLVNEYAVPVGATVVVVGGGIIIATNPELIPLVVPLM